MSKKESKIITDRHGNKITTDEIQWICQQHHLGEIQRIIGVLGGRANVPILVKTEKGKYVLRYVTHPASKERIKYIEDIILCLKEASIPVENAIKNKTGEYYSLINNRLIQVYPFIQGSSFKFVPEQIKSNARMLNRFHAALNLFKQGPLPIDSICPTEENLKIRLNRLYQHKESISNSSLSKIESLYSLLIKHWQKANEIEFKDTIIHDDWHPWNHIYNKDGSVACILDFDYVRPGKRAYDVAYCIYWIFMRSPNKSSKINSKMYLDSYDELTLEEKKFLPIVIAKVALFFIIESVVEVDNQIKVNEPLIEFLLSQGGERFFL
ncbi:phosphotransferase [Neobacillus sp. LXY-4]|uniref:phosphotransferase n=1 Tax=Neobacillus sp. LXY-4 TaxID=3379826 RepID=UPI003EDF49BA